MKKIFLYLPLTICLLALGITLVDIAIHNSNQPCKKECCPSNLLECCCDKCKDGCKCCSGTLCNDPSCCCNKNKK